MELAVTCWPRAGVCDAAAAVTRSSSSNRHRSPGLPGRIPNDKKQVPPGAGFGPAADDRLRHRDTSPAVTVPDRGRLAPPSSPGKEGD